jgi:hypothetical protein
MSKPLYSLRTAGGETWTVTLDDIFVLGGGATLRPRDEARIGRLGPGETYRTRTWSITRLPQSAPYRPRTKRRSRESRRSRRRR